MGYLYLSSKIVPATAKSALFKSNIPPPTLTSDISLSSVGTEFMSIFDNNDDDDDNDDDNDEATSAAAVAVRSIRSNSSTTSRGGIASVAETG